MDRPEWRRSWIMVYNLPPEATANNGLVGALQYLANQLPMLFPALLFFIWIIILSSGYGLQRIKSIQGKANMPMWSAISSLITTSAAIVLFLIPGILDPITLSICIVLTIVFTLWFMFTNQE
jgi:hypothetical protein